jgi:hypothetical protein
LPYPLRGLNSGRDFLVSGLAKPRYDNHAAPPANRINAFLLALFAANEKPHQHNSFGYERISGRIEIASKT